MKHKHHIVPKHMGGSDDPSNLIELSIEEHAAAHKLLFEQYGRKEDYLAWQGLAGLIDKKELVRQLLSIAGKKAPKNHNKGKKYNWRNGVKGASAGKKWYHDNINNKEIYCFENQQPQGYLLGRLKRIKKGN